MTEDQTTGIGIQELLDALPDEMTNDQIGELLISFRDQGRAEVHAGGRHLRVTRLPAKRFQINEVTPNA